MVGWHHQLNGHELEQALGDGEGQGSLVCCRVGHDLVTEQQLGELPEAVYCHPVYLIYMQSTS